MYSNIPHDLGLEAISFWIDKHTDLLIKRFDKDFIIKGLKIVLENNNFVFNNQYFNQSKGTAMGTKVAPTYASLVLGFLEEKLYHILQEDKDRSFALYIENNWKRYLDDCFMFWEKSEEDLIYFDNLLNSLHSDITFKLQQSTDECHF